MRSLAASEVGVSLGGDAYRPAADRTPPFVSVIVPCRNEAQFVGRCLDAILANDYPGDGLEVLVVDGMSEDGTREVVARYQAEHPSVTLYDNPRRSIPCALNLGLARAKGDVIVRMDAHAVCPRNYIAECVRHLEEYGADGVGGRLLTVPRAPSLVGRAIATAMSAPFGVGNSSFRITSRGGDLQPRAVDTVVFGCWRRALLDHIGGWNEKLARSEDVELNRRIGRQGGKLLMVPSLVCRYYARSDLRAVVRHAFGNGRWAVLPFKYVRGMPVSLRHLAPLALVVALIATGALALDSSTLAPLFAAVAGAYVLANLVSSVAIARRQRELAYVAILPVVFAALHVSYGLGSLVGLVEVVAGSSSSRR